MKLQVWRRAKNDTWRLVVDIGISHGEPEPSAWEPAIASAVRRFGMGGVQRMPMLKRWFMDEARGVSGNVPELMRA